jgi:hypothetical protein
MPRYYLHLRTGDALQRDPDGFEAPNVDAAVAEARRVIREVRDDWAEQGIDMSRMAFEIADDRGRLVQIVWFSDTD